MATNDNDAGTPGDPPPADDHGRAALLLVESLIHGLCEKAVLSADDAIDIAARALDVQGELAEVADGAGAPMWRSHALLLAITDSLRTETASLLALRPTP